MLTLAVQPVAVVPQAPTSIKAPDATSSTASSDAVQSTAAEEPAAEVIAEEPATPPIVPVGGAPAEIIASDFGGEGDNDLSCANLRPGDIILLGSPGDFFDFLIPGVWSHTVIFCGWVQSGEYIWDRSAHAWMAAGTPYCIHSTKSDNQGNGLGYDTWYTAINAHAGNALVLRIVKSGGALLTTTDENNMISWCKNQLAGGWDGEPVGPGYDFNWLAKQTTVDTGTEPWLPPFAPDGYYCSELAWAMAKVNLGIELDGDFSPLDVGVSPEDLYWAPATSVIAMETNVDPNGNSISNKLYACSDDLYKVTTRVYEIYYDDDYDPWPSGAGEMYFQSESGDGYFPSIEQRPLPDGIKGNDVQAWWSRDGSGALVMDQYIYDLVSYNAPLKIRICPGEVDDTSGDDWYPAYQWWWDSSWHGYINGGWYWSGSRADLGDCRYTIYFRIDSCY